MAKNLIATIGLSILLLTGCEEIIKQDAKEIEEIRLMNERKKETGEYETYEHFPKIQLPKDGREIRISHDFDDDGDLDLIIGTEYPSIGYITDLHFFENDGKGNFKLRQYSVKK